MDIVASALAHDDGSEVPADWTDAEITQHLALTHAIDREPTRIARVFPTHYPENETLYYPGLEVFVWHQGRQLTVGGIERGPASRTGIRWGDVILVVNHIDPRNNPIADLELTSDQREAGDDVACHRPGWRDEDLRIRAAASNNDTTRQ